MAVVKMLSGLIGIRLIEKLTRWEFLNVNKTLPKENKMKLAIIIPVLFAVGCGNEEDNPCDRADLNIDGICVISNDFRTISPEMISLVVSSAQDELLELYNITDDLPSLFENNSVSLEYVPAKDDKLLLRDGNYARGIALGNKIIVNYMTTDDNIGNCMGHYYVFGHELLHVIAKYNMGVSDEDNEVHNVPDMFLNWAANNDKDYRFTAEFGIYFDVLCECERIYETN